jgi:hypothetical protein
LTETCFPRKHKIFLGRGNASSGLSGWCRAPADQAKGNETYGFFPLWNPHSSLPEKKAFTASRWSAARASVGGRWNKFPLDRRGVLIEDAEKSQNKTAHMDFVASRLPSGFEGAEKIVAARDDIALL